MSSDAIEATFRTAIENKVIPGAVLVATNKSGTFNYAKAFGQTGVSPTAQPLTIDSTFWIASCTKLLTTLACFQCIERGLFSLDSPDDIARLLPELAAPQILTGFDATGPVTVPAKNRITLRQLLTHTSGMTYEFMDPRLMAWRKTPEGSRKHDDPFMRANLLPLVYEPGESWMYSVSLDWAGKLVERANSGVTLEVYMQQHIWDPLGVQGITFHLEKKGLKQVETATREPETGVLIPGKNEFIPEFISFGSGGAGLYASAPEYLKILASILRDDGKLVRSESVAEMFKAQLSPGCKDTWTTMLQLPEANAAFTANVGLLADFTWGLGGKYSLEDLPERRKKGSLSWGGLPNLYWWIDPKAGIAGLYASQVLPTGDKKSAEMFGEFEKGIYKQAQALSPSVL
ncbi:beta-lactamase/transpeptidase-like protein [Athelia psychrophila]|uniref:Beta-lactamase/transpeptidase-like protein n=1 Tax=Athelia psychrophila TaxID=1759441 RepID=A0A166NMY0_9AGAM|nr:beta-lactamase/transpeptidase-like protein [Fibularhizoctonia sp. CBS 109695]